VDLGLKERSDQGKTDKDVVCHFWSELLTDEALEGFGDFKRGGQVIRTVKYADDLVFHAKEEAVLRGMIDRLN
jgi:hypothetical protein